MNTFVWSHEAWLASQPARTVLERPDRTIACGRFATLAIGPGSVVDRVYAQPRNGPRVLVAVGAPYPVGDWEGPIVLTPTGGHATTGNPEEDGWDYLYVATTGGNLQARIEVVVYEDAPPFIPVQRSPYRGSLDVTLSVVPSVGLLDLTISGRRLTTLTLVAPAAVSFIYAIFGRVKRTAQVDIPLFPTSGTRTIAAAGYEAVTIADECFDALYVAGSSAGAGTGTIHWETRD